MSLVALLSSAAVACSAPAGAGTSISTQYNAYALRSLQIVALAEEGRAQELRELIAPDATFGIGRGDVGRPFESGPAGAIGMASELAAETYEFDAWSGIPFNHDACADISVDITFVPQGGKSAAKIKFSYANGVLTSAQGWWHGRNSGQMSEFKDG